MGRLDQFVLSLTARQVAGLAIFGVATGLLLTPFMASVWLYEPGVDWSESTFVERTFGPWLESSGLLTFGSAPLPGEDGLPYEVYGKGFFLVYLMLLPVMRVIKPADQKHTPIARAAAGSWMVMYVGTLVATALDFISYWGKSLPGAIGDTIWMAAGGPEILLVMLLSLTTLVFAASSMIAGSAPRWIPAILILSVVAIVPTNAVVTGYWPNSFIVPVSLGLAAIAVGRLVHMQGRQEGGPGKTLPGPPGNGSVRLT